MAAIYKVSYVVTGEDHPGAILNVDHMPEVGEKVELGRRRFVVVEVFELVPPRGEFHFLHATLAAADE
jgi:hypothetical protein